MGGSSSMSVEKCKEDCDATSRCWSFSYGYGKCFKKDKKISSTSKAKESQFTTYHKTCKAIEQQATAGAPSYPTPAPTPLATHKHASQEDLSKLSKQDAIKVGVAVMADMFTTKTTT